MASLRRHRQKWQVQVRRLGLPPLTKAFTLKATAEAWARETEIAIERGELKHDLARLKITSLAELCWRYSKEILPRKRGADREYYFIQTILRHPLASLSLARLSSAEIADYRDTRLQSVQSASVCRELAVLRHILETARIEWAYPFAVNPVALVSKPKLPLARNRRITQTELCQLLALAEKSRNKILGLLITIAVETGNRPDRTARTHGWSLWPLLASCRSAAGARRPCIRHAEAGSLRHRLG